MKEKVHIEAIKVGSMEDDHGTHPYRCTVDVSHALPDRYKELSVSDFHTVDAVLIADGTNIVSYGSTSSYNPETGIFDVKFTGVYIHSISIYAFIKTVEK